MYMKLYAAFSCPFYAPEDNYLCKAMLFYVVVNTNRATNPTEFCDLRFSVFRNSFCLFPMSLTFNFDIHEAKVPFFLLVNKVACTVYILL